MDDTALRLLRHRPLFEPSNRPLCSVWDIGEQQKPKISSSEPTYAVGC